MEIGKEQPARIITPVEEPVPTRQPKRQPVTVPQRTPAPAPERVPEKAPAKTMAMVARQATITAQAEIKVEDGWELLERIGVTA